MEKSHMDEPMQLTKEEKEKLLQSKDENAWYQVCDEIKARRNCQYPTYLARNILHLFQKKFPITIS